MSGTQGNAEDDLGPNGRDIVSLVLNIFCDHNKTWRRLTNDGNAILREIDVAHPAAKNMIELSRTQDEEVGDGTTSVIILGSSCTTVNV